MEQLSGEISFSTEKKYINYNDSYYIFPLESDEEILNLKIESKKNSLYSIKICYIFMEYYEGFSYNKKLSHLKVVIICLILISKKVIWSL